METQLTLWPEESINIETILDILDCISFINCGGCGVAALAIARWLAANNKDCKVKFILLDNDFVIRSRYYVPDHVVVEINETRYDTRGEIDSSYYRYTKQVDESYLLHLINKGRNWNPKFDREESVPIIEQELGIDLSDINLEI